MSWQGLLAAWEQPPWGGAGRRQCLELPRTVLARRPPPPSRALPVHSPVLSVASGALREFFDAKAAAAQANGGGVLHSLGSAPHLGSSYMLSASGTHLDVRAGAGLGRGGALADRVHA